MKIVAAVLVAFGLVLCAASAEAGKRVALVLGNGAYAHVPALPNPRRDAEAIAAALRRLGFEVELGVDLDLASMRQILLAYARKLEGAEVALFFYAGHGMQVHGQNYLLPVDAAIQSEVDLDFAAMPARLVLEQMERWPSVKIVILDACRDNPFATALSRSMGATRAARALSRGLAQIEAAGGTLLAYATDPGDVASDGAGSNSPFTQALLNHVETPGVEIHTMLTRVRADVYAATGERQRPWTESSLIGEVYLAPAPEAPPVTSAMLAPQAPAEPPPSSTLDPRQIELAVWEAAQAGGTAEDYREYLRQYPDGIFAKLARNRLAALAGSEGQQDGGASGQAGAPEGSGREPDAATDQPAAPEIARPLAGPPDEPEAAEPSVPPEVTEPSDPPQVAEPSLRPEATEPSARPEVAGPPEDGDTAALDTRDMPQTPGAPGTAEAADLARAAAAAEEKLGLDRARRREVQARLLAAGHDPRGLDGIFGPGTRAALSNWQGTQGLVPTGYLDAAALELLERRTETAFAAWTERRRAEETARRAAAERARAERQAARAAARLERARPEPARSRAAAEIARPVEPPPPTVSSPAPSPAEAPATASANRLAAPPKGGSARERYEQKCHFVFTGSTELKRVCN